MPDPFLQLGYVSLLGDQSMQLPSTNDLNACFTQAMGEMRMYASGNWLDRFHGDLGDSGPAICLWDSVVTAADVTISAWPHSSIHADYWEVMALVRAWVASGLELRTVIMSGSCNTYDSSSYTPWFRSCVCLFLACPCSTCSSLGLLLLLSLPGWNLPTNLHCGRAGTH